MGAPAPTHRSKIENIACKLVIVILGIASVFIRYVVSLFNSKNNSQQKWKEHFFFYSKCYGCTSSFTIHPPPCLDSVLSISREMCDLYAISNLFNAVEWCDCALYNSCQTGYTGMYCNTEEPLENSAPRAQRNATTVIVGVTLGCLFLVILIIGIFGYMKYKR